MTTGVLNNGIESGSLTFAPEFFQRGRALIYRTTPNLNKPELRGLLTIQARLALYFACNLYCCRSRMRPRR